MANYIDKEIICEAYTHLNIDFPENPNEQERLKRHLQKYIFDRAEFLFDKQVDVQINFVEGSLKTKITIIGSIAAIVGGGVLKYPEFRDSIKQMHQDSRMLAEAANLETVFTTKTYSCDRLHSEARTGVIGRVVKVLGAVEALKIDVNSSQAPSGEADIGRAKKQADLINGLNDESRRILEKINNDPDRYCLALGLFKAFQQLPEVYPGEKLLSQDVFRKNILQGLKLDIKATATFQDYTSAVKNAKESMKRIGVQSKPRSA